jgi:hypothetical protein
MPLLSSIRDESHLPDNRLELYLLKHSLTKSERATIEEHTLHCQYCNSRLEELQEFIDLLRTVLRAPRRSEPHRVCKTALRA